MRNLLTNSLKKLVKPEPTYATGDRTATTISVATVKGGVGKTTTAVNLASAVARQLGCKVLLVDLDGQAHCATSIADCLSTATPPARTVSEVLMSDDGTQMLDAIVETDLPNLSITAPDETLAETEGRIAQKIGKEFLLKDTLNITRTHYDYIIIDCPPNKGNLTLNALLASDFVVVPTDLSPLSVQGAGELLDTVGTINQRLHHRLEVLGVLLTRVDKRNKSVNQQVVDQVRDAWGDLLFDTQIGTNTAISKSQIAGQPVFEFDARSRGAKDYENFAREIAKAVGKHGKNTNKKSSHARRKPAGSR